MPDRVERGRDVRFDFWCADPDVLSVHLDCDGAVPVPRAFDRQGPYWSLDATMPPARELARLEYRFQLRGPEQDLLVLDETNPRRVPSVFGERSEWVAPGYREPWWLRAHSVPGESVTTPMRGLTRHPVPVTVWQPRGIPASEPLPLLFVHDGPEYDQLARITHYSAALIGEGTLPPHRLALAQPVRRDAWYSGSSRYLRSISGPVLAGITEAYAVRSPIVVMGASLGGLVSLLIGLGDNPSIGGVFSQSGSFFQPGTDPMEAGFRHFRRVSGRVGEVLATTRTDRRLRIGMTCGVLEENAANNRAMAHALAAAGHDVTHAEVPDLHNYIAWRDALDPHLTDVLTDLWT